MSKAESSGTALVDSKSIIPIRVCPLGERGAERGGTVILLHEPGAVELLWTTTEIMIYSRSTSF